MKKYSQVATLGLSLVISGCATPLPSINDIDPNKLTSDQALLVISAGANETCTSFSSALVIKDSSKKTELTESIGTFQLNNSFVKSDFEQEYGKIYTTILKPGQYDLWLYSQNPYALYKNPLLVKPFNVKGGEIKYIGELHADGCGNLNIKVNNKSERDLKLLKTLKPELDLKKILIEPAEVIQTPQEE